MEFLGRSILEQKALPGILPTQNRNESPTPVESLPSELLGSLFPHYVLANVLNANLTILASWISKIFPDFLPDKVKF